MIANTAAYLMGGVMSLWNKFRLRGPFEGRESTKATNAIRCLRISLETLHSCGHSAFQTHTCRDLERSCFMLWAVAREINFEHGFNKACYQTRVLCSMHQIAGWAHLSPQFRARCVSYGPRLSEKQACHSSRPLCQELNKRSTLETRDWALDICDCCI